MVWDSPRVYTKTNSMPFKLGSKWIQREKNPLAWAIAHYYSAYSTHWGSFLFITHCLQSTAPLKDMQVHSSIYLLFSPQEFNCFSAWWFEWIGDFELIHQIWKWSLNWWECLTVNWTFLLGTFLVSKCRNASPRDVGKEKGTQGTSLPHKYFHPLDCSRF